MKSAGKVLSAWPSVFVALFGVCVPLPSDVSGRMWNSIVSVPDHCLFMSIHRNGYFWF